MSQRRGPKITSDPTLGGTKQRAEETEEENIRPEPPLSRNEGVTQNEDNTDLNSDLSNINQNSENNDDTDLDDLFNVQTEEELEKIANQGKENYGDNDLSNVNTDEDYEIPTYNEDDI